MTREEVAEQERNALHPKLLRVATFAVVLSGALLLMSFIGSFVMFMNAREDARKESIGTYHISCFSVLRVYWRKGKAYRVSSGLSSSTQAVAFGTVEGHEEWLDLIPSLGFIPQDEETVQKAFPVGTTISVYYNPQLQGEYRVRRFSDKLPAEANRHTASVVFRYGILALLLTAIMLFGCLRLRKFAIGLA